jgi:hypothetical protein
MTELVEEILNGFYGNYYIRGLGNPIRKGIHGYYTATDAQGMIEFMKANGWKNVYATAYGFTEYDNPKEDKYNAVIDTIPFDFDHNTNVSYAHSDATTLKKWCDRHNITPRLTYSGKKGHHVYIDIEPVELQYPDKVIRRFVKEMAESAQFKTTMDTSVIGDLNRILRIPTSIHKSTGRYCTALDPDTFLNKSIKEILDMSKVMQDYIPEKVTAPYEINSYLKHLDVVIAEEEAEKMISPQEMIQGSILANIWNPEIPRGAGVLHCIAFERAMSTGSIQGHHGDETLSGVIQKLRSDNLSEEELTKRVYEFNKLCKPPFSTSFLDYKIEYHMSNPYAPCTFFLKCGDLCKGCHKVESGQVGQC